MECKQIGMMQGGKWDKMHEQSRRVYDQSGLSPALNTCGGGGHDIKIAEPMEKPRKDIKEEIKYCAYCRKQLQRKRYNGRLEDFGVFKKRKYCDMKCMAQGFTQEEHHGESWTLEHRIAREIKGKGVCEICGSDKNIDVHHKDGNWHNNDINNLQNLCRSCHIKAHRGGDEMQTQYRIRKLTPKECLR